ncbi:MAG: AAA family ATPase [candidate division NC10 bacterium]|nr:AAA family ATPase [candidate division NC10 bacterium]
MAKQSGAPVFPIDLEPNGNAGRWAGLLEVFQAFQRWQQSPVNQLDGFPANTGVLTIATTNDLKAIEPALAERPSRFDHILRMEPPRMPER